MPVTCHVNKLKYNTAAGLDENRVPVTCLVHKLRYHTAAGLDENRVPVTCHVNKFKYHTAAGLDENRVPVTCHVSLWYLHFAPPSPAHVEQFSLMLVSVLYGKHDCIAYSAANLGSVLLTIAYYQTSRGFLYLLYPT